MGLRNLATLDTQQKKAKKKAAGPSFKQYKEGEQFFFKLVDASGKALRESEPFASHREAAQAIATLTEGLRSGAPVRRIAADAEIAGALQLLRESGN